METVDIYQTFGDLLKYLRIRAQLTQKDLSIAVGYSEAQISRLESNKRPPNPDALRALFVPALGLENEPEVVNRLLGLAEGVKEPERSKADPAAISTGKCHNLPAELTSLIGREAELAEIARILCQPGTRLLTLTGSGGCGKTRLALRSGCDLAGRFQDGTWLVELAPLSDPSLVTQAVITTLGLLVEPDRALLDALTAFLKEREVLLILDNCEHLIDAAAQLALALLRACPRLKILATSREQISLPGEIAYRVPSLAIPPSDWDGRPEITAAAQLFLERAASAQPGFRLDEREGPALAYICRRLDGIPLAIELAAARTNVLVVPEIAARLEEGFRVLGAGGRGRMPRHATLRATVEWSYQLLTEAERALLRRLPLFAGGWRLEQAEEACAFDGLEREDVLDLLAALVNKSLVSTERQFDGSLRYRMHEMVRQYARERLEAAHEHANLRRRFLDTLIRLLEQAEPWLRSAAQIQWLERLDQDRENLVEALSMASKSQDALAALRLSGASIFYWIYTEKPGQGRYWLEQALALAEAEAAQNGGPKSETAAALARSQAKAMEGLLWLHFLTWETIHENQVSACEQIYRSLGDTYRATLARAFHSVIAGLPDRTVQLRSSLPETLARGDEWNAAVLLYMLQDGEHAAGNFELAHAYYRDCITHMRAAGDRIALAFFLASFCWLEWDEGNVRKAYESCVESFDYLTLTGMTLAKTLQYQYMAYYAAALGKFAEGYRHFEHALALAESIGASTMILLLHIQIGRNKFLEGRLGEAVEELSYWREPQRAKSVLWLATGQGQYNLAMSFLYQYDLDRAGPLLESSLEIGEKDGDQSFLPGPLRSVGKLRLLQGNLSEANHLITRSLAIIARHRTLPDFPETLDLLAQVRQAEGHPEAAAGLLGASDGLQERMEMKRYPVFIPEYEQCLAQAREMLGETAFAQAYAQGLDIARSPNPIEGVTEAARS